jgi:hypothetical protein
MWYQSRFFPLMILIPILYGEHLYSASKPKPGAIRRGLAAFFGSIFGFFALLNGFMLRGHRTPELIMALGALLFGIGSVSPLVTLPKVPTGKRKFPKHPLAPRRTSFLRGVWHTLLLINLFLAGFFLSLFRYKLKIPIDLFKILGKLAKGLSGARRAPLQ